MAERLGGSVTYDSCDVFAPNAVVDELPKAEPNVRAARALLACAMAARLLKLGGGIERERRGMNRKRKINRKREGRWSRELGGGEDWDCGRRDLRSTMTAAPQRAALVGQLPSVCH